MRDLSQPDPAAARLLFFADLHLDTPFAWAGPEVARGRRRAIRDCLERICQLAAHLRVDALCCAGDLYEQDRFTPDTAALLRESFAGLAPMPVLLAAGNHDWLGPASLYRQVSWSANVHLFPQPKLTAYPLADGLSIWGASHAGPANTPGFLDGFRVDRSGVHIGLFHGSERGELAAQDQGKVPHAPFQAQQVGEAGLHHALVGHFHTPKDGAYHTYPGNPQPLTFGETGQRGPVLVGVAADGTVTRQRYQVAGAPVHDVEVALDGVAHSGEVRARVAAALGALTGVARVTVTGSVDPAVEVDLGQAEQLAPHLEAVLIRRRDSTGYDLERLAAERTVRGQFVRDVQAAQLTPPQRRRVLETGLRAFDPNREDLEVH